MNDLIKQFKGASATTQLIVVLMVGVLIYFGWKYIKGKGAAVSHFINNQSQQSVLANNGITTSLLNNDYESIADSMYEAMDGPGTDSTIIMGGFEQILIIYVTLPLRTKNMKQIFADTPYESPVSVKLQY